MMDKQKKEMEVIEYLNDWMVRTGNVLNGENAIIAIDSFVEEILMNVYDRIKNGEIDDNDCEAACSMMLCLGIIHRHVERYGTENVKLKKI